MKLLTIAPVVWSFYKYRDQELPTELARRGHHCIYLNPVRYKNWQRGSIRLQSFSMQEIPAGVDVIERTSRLRKSVFSFLYEILNNVKHIRTQQPDAVICTDHLMGVLACLYCYNKKIPFVFDCTDDWAEVDKGLFTSYFWKHFARRIFRKYAFAITSTSHEQANYFKLKNKRTFVIPNGKPLDFITAIEAAPVVPISNTVNFVGSLRDWYDFDLLFDVFSNLPEMELNIYGMGDLYQSLHEKSAGFPTIHVKGNAPAALLPSLLKESCFGIIPLKINKLNQSTCPIKLFDYWCANKAVIVTPVTEVKNIAGESVLYAGNKEEILMAIQSLYNDESLKERLGNEGLKKIQTQHNYNVIADEFIKIIQQ